MSRIHALMTKRVRVVAGIMSGTSADGIDVAIARLEGTGPGIGIEILAHRHVDYEPEFREIVLAHALDKGATVKSISQLNVALAHAYREAVEETLEQASMSANDLDLVGCHGQTVQHVPDPESVGRFKITSTLQLGDPSVLANLLGVPVVGNFRLADMALGGQGAPLVPYFDYVAFSDPTSYRVLLNLGGIANITFLLPGGRADQVIAFDTGPANMLIDFLTEKLFGIPMDRDGRIAGTAEPDKAIMSDILKHDYFHRSPPKTTGRELFNDVFADDICRRFEGVYGQHSQWTEAIRQSVISSVTWLTARSVASAITTWSPISRNPDLVIAAGGGTLNPTLMRMLQGEIGGVPIDPIDKFGIGFDLKEALCFAVLAHEYVNETPTGMPSVTGARTPGLLGSLCLPSDPAED